MKFFEINCPDLLLHKAIRQIWKVKRYSYQSVSRPDNGFLYLISGSMTFYFEKDFLQVNAGDIIFLPKNCNYDVEFDFTKSTVEDLLINFDVSDREYFSNCKMPMHILNDSSKLLLNSFQDVVEAYMNSSGPYLLKSLFYLCIHRISIYQKQTCDKMSYELEKAARLLSEQGQLSVDAISKSIHMSKSTFQKKFKTTFNMSPIEYRTIKRIEKAKQLLETTDMPIKEIADTLGFYDTAYFYKVFKKYCGVTPKAFQSNIKPSL